MTKFAQDVEAISLVIDTQRARIAELEALLRELIDIEGPQPGHVMWANKVKAALNLDHPSCSICRRDHGPEIVHECE